MKIPNKCAANRSGVWMGEISNLCGKDPSLFWHERPIVSIYLSSLPVAHMSGGVRRRLVVTGDIAWIKDESAVSSAWFSNVLGV